MANSSLKNDYLNLIERALMMGISDTLNKEIRTWDLPSGFSGLEDITAAALNAIDEDALPRNLANSYKLYLNNPLSAYAASDIGASSGGFEQADDKNLHITLYDNEKVDAGDLIYIKGCIYEAKTSGADITLNQYNIGTTSKETLTNLKAAIEDENSDLDIELIEYKIIRGNHPNLVDVTEAELRFNNSHSKNDLIEMERRGNLFPSENDIPFSKTATLGASGSCTLQENVTSSDKIWTVSDASQFSELGGEYFLIDRECFKVTSIDTTANTITVQSQLSAPDAIQTHSSGTSIKWLKNFQDLLGKYTVIDFSSSGLDAYNNPPRGAIQEATLEGFHVYGTFPSSESVQFPAIVVQQVASGFEEKFFGDSVTFGSDTTTSSGEVYGMTFLIHIFTDEETIIPLGNTGRYGQRRLTNWMMLNIANAIQGLDWAVYQEQELEVIERHLNQWRDIGYMPQAGWYGATAEFDIYFLNKR